MICEGDDIIKDKIEKIIEKNKIKIVFMGTPDFAVRPLRLLFDEGYSIEAVVTQPDKPQGRKMILQSPPVKLAALDLGLKVIQPDCIKSEDFHLTLSKINPDLIITAAYGKILPKRILDIPHMCINIHASLLPQYRGASPIQRAIYNGDKKTGITIMLMDEGMDTGDILVQKSIDIPQDMNAPELTEALSKLGAGLLVESLPDILTGKIKPQKQNLEEGSIVRPVRKEEGRINWNETSMDIHNKVRGSVPWPGAFTFCKGKRMKIICTGIPDGIQPLTPEDFHQTVPGQLIVSDNKERIFVRCLDGFIEILELQMEGCRSLSADDCAHNFDSSIVLGN